MCLWELQDNTGSSPSLIRFTYRRWPLKMYEDIDDNGGMWRYSHWRLWHEKTMSEDYGARRLCCFVVSFSSLLSHRNHRTVKWGPREPVRMTEVMPKPKTYVFEWRQWERILSRAGQVSFACSPSKVAMRVWNLTVETRVSSLVTQGHFGQIRSGCQVAINSPPPTTINGWLLRFQCTAFVVWEQPTSKPLRENS